MSAPAGWFPDPAESGSGYRWWDGRHWSRWLSADPGSPAPGPEPQTVTPQTVAPETAAPETAATRTADVTPEGRPVRVPLAVAAVVGVVVLALLAVGFTVIMTEDRIRTGPPVAPPAPVAELGLRLDPATRTARAENVQMVLPTAPYVCGNRPGALAPGLSSALSCDAPIHRNYAGQQDWYASVGLGLVAGDLTVPGDPARTADNLWTALRRQFFGGQRTTVQKLARVSIPGISAEQGAFWVGEVHYAVPGLPSRYDRLVVGVFPLPSGQQAAVYSSRPNDASATTVAVLNRALDSLQIR